MLSYSFYRHIDYGRNTLDRIAEIIGEFVGTLKELQVLCVTLQYRHHYEGRLDAEMQEQREIFKADKSTGRALNVYALNKALRCIHYQIETGHLTQLRQLTETEQTALDLLTDLIGDLSTYIVCHSEQYEAAKWEIN